MRTKRCRATGRRTTTDAVAIVSYSPPNIPRYSPVLSSDPGLTLEPLAILASVCRNLLLLQGEADYCEQGQHQVQSRGGSRETVTIDRKTEIVTIISLASFSNNAPRQVLKSSSLPYSLSLVNSLSTRSCFNRVLRTRKGCARGASDHIIVLNPKHRAFRYMLLNKSRNLCVKLVQVVALRRNGRDGHCRRVAERRMN